MRSLLRLLFMFMVSPLEWRDMRGFFRTRQSEARRARSIRRGELADIEDGDPLP